MIRTTGKSTVRIEGDLVEKIYYPNQAHYFHAQDKVLRQLERFGTSLFVQPREIDEERLRFVFPYAGKNFEEYILEHGVSTALISNLIKAMIKEVQMMQRFPTTKELIHPRIGHYKYSQTSRLIEDGNVNNEHEKMLSDLVSEDDGRNISLRTDPEASNYCVDDEGNIKIIDLCYLRMAHPLYLPAYFITHLDRPREKEFAEYSGEIRDEVITMLSDSEYAHFFVEDTDDFDSILRINMIEVYAYLLNLLTDYPQIRCREDNEDLWLKKLYGCLESLVTIESH